MLKLSGDIFEEEGDYSMNIADEDIGGSGLGGMGVYCVFSDGNGIIVEKDVNVANDNGSIFGRIYLVDAENTCLDICKEISRIFRDVIVVDIQVKQEGFL